MGGDAMRRGLEIPALLLGVDVPDDVVGQAPDAVPGALGHFGEALGFGLVLEGVGGEVDSWVVLASPESERERVGFCSPDR